MRGKTTECGMAQLRLLYLSRTDVEAVGVTASLVYRRALEQGMGTWLLL